MDARPDQEEMEQATNKFLQPLEMQEKKGFKEMATLLLQLPKPGISSGWVFPVYLVISLVNT